MPTSKEQRARLNELVAPPVNRERVAAWAQEVGAHPHEVERVALERGLAPERFSRNIGTLGFEGQRKLLEAHVLVVGLGGLGGHLVETLARLGVGRLTGVDRDVFDESNLNRQLFADTETLGRSKAEVARERVLRIDPWLEFLPYAAPFESLNPQVLAGCALAFDGLDSVPARLTLAARCDAAGVTLVHGAIAGTCGQVAVCRPGSGLLQRLYAGARSPRGAEATLGNLPLTAAIVANLMVATALPLLLGGQAPERTASGLLPFGDGVRFFELPG